MAYKADRRLYLNADKTKIVEEGDPDAAWLFATPGTEVSDEDVEKYGLKAVAKAPANKAVAKAEATKDKD